MVCKRILILISLMSIALLVVGCGPKASETTTTGTTATGTTTTGTTTTGTTPATSSTKPLILYQNAPATYQELPLITAAELKAMLDSGEDVIVVDVNPLNMYNAGHVPGAIHVNWSFSGFSKDPNLPKNVLLVFYCTCEHEEDSGLMAISAVTKYGYRNIKLLLGGNPAWKAAGYAFETG